ncbi:MAG: leucine-rich repeat domain-containing protein [Dehalococcoidales bacterium]|nr:leucine-rich repeat domain-containing protein [Dehalococcoidales bacterium]
MLKRALLLLLVMAMMTGVFTCISCTDTRNDNEITFPDPNLEMAVREAIGKLEGPICLEDLQELTLLSATDMGIYDLSGLEHCTNLSLLYLGNNEITDVSPLSNLNKLTTLHIVNNQVSDITPLTSLSNLTALDLSWNKITDISSLSSASLPNLSSLGLNGSPESNQISDISSLATLTNLRTVMLWNNQISDVSPLLELPELETVFILQGNPLDNDSLNIYIPELEARAVQVI